MHIFNAMQESFQKKNYNEITFFHSKEKAFDCLAFGHDLDEWGNSID